MHTLHRWLTKYLFSTKNALFSSQELQLVPGSSTINDWVKSDIPQYETYYIFDTKNPDEFCVGDIPIVEEVGPFVYR